MILNYYPIIQGLDIKAFNTKVLIIKKKRKTIELRIYGITIQLLLLHVIEILITWHLLIRIRCSIVTKHLVIEHYKKNK